MSVAISQVVFIIFILSLFATSFGVFISTISKTLESSFAVGNMFVILTTLVSGGVVAVTDNRIFELTTRVLPQRQIMDYISNLENGATANYTGMIYIIIISAFLIFVGVYNEKRLISRR